MERKPPPPPTPTDCVLQPGTEAPIGQALMAARPPTLVLTAALVLDDVLVVERAQDVDLPPPASAELRAAVRLESLHGHHLASAFVGRVIAVQADLAEVTLAKTQDSQRPTAPAPPLPAALPTCGSLSNSQTPPLGLTSPRSRIFFK